MMKYVLVENGKIIRGPQELPINWENVSNFYALEPEYLKTYGWYPYKFISVELNVDEKYIEPIITIGDTEVIEQQQKRKKTEQEMLEETENSWQNIRSRRNIELQESDWTQLSDSPLPPEKKTEWQLYRQQLRDITSYLSPHEISWPQKPE